MKHLEGLGFDLQCGYVIVALQDFSFHLHLHQAGGGKIDAESNNASPI